MSLAKFSSVERISFPNSPPTCFWSLPCLHLSYYSQGIHKHTWNYLTFLLHSRLCILPPKSCSWHDFFSKTSTHMLTACLRLSELKYGLSSASYTTSHSNWLHFSARHYTLAGQPGSKTEAHRGMGIRQHGPYASKITSHSETCCSEKILSFQAFLSFSS